MQVPLYNIFQYYKHFVIYCKRKYLSKNQPDQDNRDGSGEKNNHRLKNKQTQIFDFL